MAKMKLKRVDVFSVAKWHVPIQLIAGFLLGSLYTLFFFIRGQGSPRVAVWYIGFFPIIYGIIAFIASAVTCILYNAAAASWGGMEFEFEDVNYVLQPPPPPPEWNSRQTPSENSH